MTVEPSVAVCICTRDRRDLLPLTLEGIGRLTDASGWEVLIVDNGSTDGTREYLKEVKRFWHRCPLRVVSEPVAGLSSARNRALQELKTDIVAYLDDDAVPGREWLTEIRGRFARCPRAAVVGGPIRLEWLGGRPAWMHPDLEGYFSGLDFGPDDRLLEAPYSPYGANFAIRRSVALELSGFRTELGYRGGVMIGGEDTQMAAVLRQMGWQIWYCAGASVRHLIPAERATIKWLLRRAYSGGLTEAQLKREKLHGVARMHQFVSDLRWFRYSVLALRRAAALGDSEIARADARHQYALGRMRGWVGLN